MKLSRVLSEAQAFYSAALAEPTDIYQLTGRPTDKHGKLVVIDLQGLSDTAKQIITALISSEVLQAAGLSRARGVVIAYPDRHSAEKVLKAVRRKREDLPVIVRTPDDTDVPRLKAAGATEVIPETLEGSLMIAAETLAQIGVPMERAIAHVREARAERYASLREFYSKRAH